MQEKYKKAVVVLQKWGNRLLTFVNRISIKKMVVCAAILLAVSLLPLLVLGKYNVMCIDDYDYGRQVYETWTTTGSFAESIQTALRQTGEFYRDWQGTYVSCFLMAICPMNFRYDIAFLVPIIMIGMFATGTFLLGRQILTRWLGSDKWRASFVMLLILFLFYQVLEAPFEGIYWYNGSTHYILMEALLFMMLTAVSGSIWTEKRKNAVFWCILACIGGVIVGGGNLVTGLQAEILLILLVIYTFVRKKDKKLFAILPCCCFTAGFLCNVLAPGNIQRSAVDMDTGYSPVLAIVLSFYYGVVFVIEWTSLMVVLVWLALLPVLWQIGVKSEKKFTHPVWVTIGAVCLLAAMFTPTLYAIGMVGLSRVDNIIQMVYYLCLFFVTTYWFGWISHREQAQDLRNQKDSQKKVDVTAGKAIGLFLEKTRNVMTTVCLLLVLMVWVLTANKNTYTSVSALRSLVNGDAQTYYAEAMERHELYTDESITDVVVKPYSAKPALFDFGDLTEEEGNWLNLAVTRYYHKNSVKLEN